MVGHVGQARLEKRLEQPGDEAGVFGKQAAEREKRARALHPSARRAPRRHIGVDLDEQLGKADVVDLGFGVGLGGVVGHALDEVGVRGEALHALEHGWQRERAALVLEDGRREHARRAQQVGHRAVRGLGQHVFPLLGVELGGGVERAQELDADGPDGRAVGIERPPERGVRVAPEPLVQHVLQVVRHEGRHRICREVGSPVGAVRGERLQKAEAEGGGGGGRHRLG